MAANQFSTRPIYLQLRDTLAERIAAGEWKPRHAIPNETDLAREYGVSPGTMRKALCLMESERLITRRQGRGTFINDQSSDGLADRFCGIRAPDGRPVAGRFEAPLITEAAANVAECQRLQLPSQTPVWRVRRVRLFQDQAFMWEEASLPVALFPGLSDRNSSRIVILAQEYGLLLGAAQERVSIGTASWDAAEALDIAQGSPVTVLDRVVHTIDGRPVEWRVGQCHLAENHYLAQMG